MLATVSGPLGQRDSSGTGVERLPDPGDAARGARACGSTNPDPDRSPRADPDPGGDPDAKPRHRPPHRHRPRPRHRPTDTAADVNASSDGDTQADIDTEADVDADRTAADHHARRRPSSADRRHGQDDGRGRRRSRPTRLADAARHRRSERRSRRPPADRRRRHTHAEPSSRSPGSWRPRTASSRSALRRAISGRSDRDRCRRPLRSRSCGLTESSEGLTGDDDRADHGQAEEDGRGRADDRARA